MYNPNDRLTLVPLKDAYDERGTKCGGMIRFTRESDGNLVVTLAVDDLMHETPTYRIVELAIDSRDVSLVREFFDYHVPEGFWFGENTPITNDTELTNELFRQNKDDAWRLINNAATYRKFFEDSDDEEAQ